jgi:GDPmannose 4,6-dehydratase
LGWSVHGTLRRNSTPEHQENRIEHLGEAVETYYADLTDPNSMSNLVSYLKPDMIFNLAAQSHVRISFDIPNYTAQVNAIGALSLFEIVRKESPESRVYQASSSEMFGTAVDLDGYQRETTPMLPASPYGSAKLFAYHSARTYRDSYGLFIANGILFNHESPRRGSNFVTSKIVKGALQIFAGRSRELYLGNLDAFRDWGHSRDYVKAMLKILELEAPKDLVIATGQTRSVRDLCQTVFNKLNLDYENYVKIDPKFYRPKEVPLLKGDARKAQQALGWNPETTFESLIEEMIDLWAEKLNIKIT